MPFRSERQRRFLWAKHPEIAARWTAKYGSKVSAEKALTEAGRRRKRKKARR